MTKKTGVGRIKTQFLEIKKYKYLELKIGKGRNDSLSYTHTEEIQVILQKSIDLLRSSILNNYHMNIRKNYGLSSKSPRTC